MSFFKNFSSSAKRIHDVRSLMGASMLLALNVILDMMGTFYISQELRIGFGFLAAGLCGALYGPVMAMATGALSDIISYLLNPVGPYFPGFTITAILGGLIFGVLLYNKKPNIIRCFVAKGLINLLLNVLLNTFWHAVFYKKAAEVLIPARFIKNISLWPIESILLFIVLAALLQVLERSGLYKSNR